MAEMVAVEEETEQTESLPWKEYQHFIGGEWVDSTSDERITTVDPSTEEPLGTIPLGTAEDVDRAVAAAQKAHEFGHWRRMPTAERARIVRRVGEIMMGHRDEIARAETLDQGRPIRQSQGMIVPLAASAWDFMASALMTFHGASVRPAPWYQAIPCTSLLASSGPSRPAMCPWY